MFVRVIKDIRRRAKEARPLSRAELQHYIGTLHHESAQLTDILSGYETKADAYKGSQYNSYESRTNQLSLMYDGKATWGNQIAKNIIDVRAAFTVGGGIKPKAKKEGTLADREMKYIQEFIDQNNINEEKPLSWAKESEIEGKFLCRLFPNMETKQIEARFVPWTAFRYKIETDVEDYEKYTKATYRINSLGRDVVIQPDDFIFKKFGGRTHVVNETPSKCAMIIDSIENLDKALWDWRQINYFFASPTPYFECLDEAAAKKLNELIKKINWKIGKAIASTAKFSLVSMSGDVKESVMQEIIMYLKMTSGSTGVPPHFLGMPDLMSNRAVSSDLFDLIYAATENERKCWAGGYEEIFQKALAMANKHFNMGFDPLAVGAEVPFISEHKMQELIDVWLPLYNSQVIDLDTMLSKIPDIDPEKVKESREDDMRAQLDEMKATEAIRQEAAGAETETAGARGGQQ